MPAAATARKPAPRAAARTRRGAVGRSTAPAPRRAPRPAPPRLVPVAVGRTAVAVGGIADSHLVLSLTRSKLWIGVLGTLLVGIVGLNVAALSFNASSSKTAGVSDELRRENSALVTQIADGLSNERLQSAAVRLGLIVPEPGSILYLEPRAGDAAAAAERLRRGQITLGSAYVAPVAPPVAPIAEETVDPAGVDPVADPAAVDPAAADPAAATPPAPDAGGVTLP